MNLTKKQISHLNRMNAIACDVKLGTLLESLIDQTTKEKYFCNHCFTISEKTDERGNCIACGAPFGKE